MSVAIDFQAWLDRWEAQQNGYLGDRESRFQVLFDALEGIVGPEPGTVLDIGCGPGSLGRRLLERFPTARVMAVDVDPVLLALGRGALGDRAGLTFVDADLRDPGWRAALPLDGPADAAVSTTALHWLTRDEIERLYGELAGLLRPGAAFLDGDHRRFGPENPRLAAAARRMAELHAVRRSGVGPEAESWEAWWEAVRAEPALAEAVTRRDRLGHAHPHGRHELRDEDHCRLLQAAGFAEAGVLWQHGDDRVLCAVR